MTRTASSRSTSITRRYGIRLRRALGQNFLEDPAALRQVVEAAALGADDEVLEIGSGVGNLTKLLAEAAGRVIAVEIDTRLAEICRRELSEWSNVGIVHGDILKLTPRELGMSPGYVVAANIPYYITSPILHHLLEAELRPRALVLTVQKEVAARICAQTPEMSLLSVSVQIHGVVRRIADIPARAFRPIPKVDSAILRLDCYERSLAADVGTAAFFHVVRAGFLQPRKMLRNSMSAGLRVPTRDVERLLHETGIDGRRRAETLSVEDWLKVAALYHRTVT